jgi:hypothetical protein
MCIWLEACCYGCLLVALGLLWQSYGISRSRFAKGLMTWFFDIDGDLDVSNEKMSCRKQSSTVTLPSRVQ